MVLEGYRNLTGFVFRAVEEKAPQIVKERQIIVSERDSELFFKEITNHRNPNEFLLKAVEKYKMQSFE